MKSLKHLLYLVIISPALLAQSAAPLLIDVDSLSKHLNDRNLVILEVGDKSAYDAKHVPGAHYVSLQDLSTGADSSGPMSHKPGELMLELLPADVLRAKLSSFGISDDSHIVVYSDSDRLFPFATRVIFTLQYVGLGDHTSLLNGGMSAWTKGGKPTTDKLETFAPGKLTAQPTKNIVADADVVRSIPKLPGYKLVDARAPAFYKGVDSSFDQAGHIPGAVNIPFSDVIGSVCAPVQN
jgi:thiosulfate/3-mercaptopyruvate sulfurtransferase